MDIKDSSFILVTDDEVISNLESLSISDSEVYLETREDMEAFQCELDIELDYTTPENWAVYTNGELSEIASIEQIHFPLNAKTLEIRYIHECSSQGGTSDGADTHTGICECGETVTEPHTWDEGIVTKKPQIGVTGEKTYTCTVCGETKIEIIEALPSDSEEDKEPETGDFAFTPYVMLFLVSLTAVLLSCKKRKTID